MKKLIIILTILVLPKLSFGQAWVNTAMDTVNTYIIKTKPQVATATDISNAIRVALRNFALYGSTQTNSLLKTNNLSDLTNVIQARQNLGLASFATKSSLSNNEIISYLGYTPLNSTGGTISGSIAPLLTLQTSSSNGVFTTFKNNSTTIGYVGSPYYNVFSGNPNDMSIVAVNNLTFGTNGYQRLFIDNSGNVGIGNVSPTTKLDVNGGIKGTTIQITNGASSGYYLQTDASGNGTWVNPASTFAKLAPSSTQTISGTNIFSGTVKIPLLGTGVLVKQGLNGVLYSDTNDSTDLAMLLNNQNIIVKTFRLTTGATNNYILKSDASGNGTWVAPTNSLVGLGNVVNSLQVINSGGVVSLASGLLSARPTAGTNGRIYYATDNGTMYFDNGSSWAITEPAIGGDVTIAQGGTTATVTKINGTSLAGLATGILKITTGTGVPSIAVSGTDYAPATSGTSILKGNGSGGFSTATAGTDYIAPYSSQTANYFFASPNGSAGTPTFRAIVAADIPTLNQNTTGSAATLTTSRSIYGNNFNGSADLTQIIASTYGGTGNGFTKFTGATISEKTYTLPNASATILTDNSTVTVAQGGTGATSFTAGRVLFGNGSSALNTNTNLFWDNTNSRLGIGTATPSYSLDVNGQSRFLNTILVSAYGFLTWGGGAASTFNLTGSSGMNLSLGSNGVYDRLFLDVNGKVGIGTSSPNNTLEVNGRFGMNVKGAKVAGTDNPDGTGTVWIYTSGSGTITLPSASSNTGAIYFIRNNTGAGRTTSAYLDLTNTSVTALANNTGIMIVSDGTNWQQIK